MPRAFRGCTAVHRFLRNPSQASAFCKLNTALCSGSLCLDLSSSACDFFCDTFVHENPKLYTPTRQSFHLYALIHITICQGYLLPCKVKHHEASKPRSRGHDQFSAIATRCALTPVLPLSPFSLGIVHMHATHAHTYHNPSVSVGCSEAVRKSLVSVAGT